MASLEERERLVGKALLDPAFRAALMRDPVAAAEDLGIHLTDKETRQIRNVDAATVRSGMSALEEALGPPGPDAAWTDPGGGLTA